MEKNIKKELHENGYVIIKNILTEDEINEYREYFFKWKDSIANFDELHKKINPHYIYKYHQVGHQRFAWKLRINKKIQNVFKELWDTSELVVSFDGCCYMPRYSTLTTGGPCTRRKLRPRRLAKCRSFGPHIAMYVQVGSQTHRQTQPMFDGVNRVLRYLSLGFNDPEQKSDFGRPLTEAEENEIFTSKFIFLMKTPQ
jgi:hypothetical protein